MVVTKGVAPKGALEMGRGGQSLGVSGVLQGSATGTCAADAAYCAIEMYPMWQKPPSVVVKSLTLVP